MKSILIALVLTLSIVYAQRPGYISGPIGLPELAPRFRDTTSSEPTDLGNRLGDSGTTQKIPIDARGDADLIKRVNEWPRPNRPFWVLNAEHIEKQRNTPGNTRNVNNQPTLTGSNTNTNRNPQQQQPTLAQRFGEGNSVLTERRQQQPARLGFIPGSLP